MKSDTGISIVYFTNKVLASTLQFNGKSRNKGFCERSCEISPYDCWRSVSSMIDVFLVKFELKSYVTYFQST